MTSSLEGDLSRDFVVEELPSKAGGSCGNGTQPKVFGPFCIVGGEVELKKSVKEIFSSNAAGQIM